MGVDCIGRIKGFVPFDKIVEYIRDTYDDDVNGKPSVANYDCGKFAKVFYSPDCKTTSTTGFINFRVNDVWRNLFYSYNNYNTYENYDYYKDNYEDEVPDILDAVTSEYTTIMLGHDKVAEKVIRDIIENFNGGWIDENDSDDTPFVYVSGNNNVFYTPIMSPTINVDLGYERIKKMLNSCIDYIKETNGEDNFEQVLEKIGITRPEMLGLGYIDEV